MDQSINLGLPEYDDSAAIESLVGRYVHDGNQEGLRELLATCEMDQNHAGKGADVCRSAIPAIRSILSQQFR